MKSHNAMRDEEAVDASWEAARGAVYGAIKWGAVTAALGGMGYALSPIYRGLTIQFKVYVDHRCPNSLLLSAWPVAPFEFAES